MAKIEALDTTYLFSVLLVCVAFLPATFVLCTHVLMSFCCIANSNEGREGGHTFLTCRPTGSKSGRLIL